MGSMNGVTMIGLFRLHIFGLGFCSDFNWISGKILDLGNEYFLWKPKALEPEDQNVPAVRNFAPLLFSLLDSWSHFLPIFFSLEQWKNPGWIGYKGEYATQLYRDYMGLIGIIVIHYKDPY